MKHLLRFLFNDAVSYLALVVAAVGLIVVWNPVENMPLSYGWWVVCIGSSVATCRALKALLLLTFGKRQSAQVQRKQIDHLGWGTIRYSFSHDNQPFFASWFAAWQERDLIVAYWERYPAFHIAYWGSPRST